MKHFTFWKENRTDQEHEKTGDQLESSFMIWLTKKEVSWLNYYRSDVVIRSFLSDPDGINSVFKESEYQDIYDLLKPLYLKHMKEVDPKNWGG